MASGPCLDGSSVVVPRSMVRTRRFSQRTIVRLSVVVKLHGMAIITDRRSPSTRGRCLNSIRGQRVDWGWLAALLASVASFVSLASVASVVSVVSAGFAGVAPADVDPVDGLGQKRPRQAVSVLPLGGRGSRRIVGEGFGRRMTLIPVPGKPQRELSGSKHAPRRRTATSPRSVSVPTAADGVDAPAASKRYTDVGFEYTPREGVSKWT